MIVEFRRLKSKVKLSVDIANSSVETYHIGAILNETKQKENGFDDRCLEQQSELKLKLGQKYHGITKIALVEHVFAKNGGQEECPKVAVRVQLLAHVHQCLVVVHEANKVRSGFG